MRVVSLLPSATEIVCGVGAREHLVGVSHECDHPADIAGLPVLTQARLRPAATSADVDRSVRDAARDALAVYEIDTDLLASLEPDVVVTQDLCDVCAVSYDAVVSAVAELAGSPVRVVSLKPLRLDDIWQDILRTGQALLCEARAESLVAELRARVQAVRATAARAQQRPRVLTVEWIEPVMPGGTWMPEMVLIAGGESLAARPGEKTAAVALEALRRMDPEVLLLKPCGFPIARTLAELTTLPRVLPWTSWTAVRDGRVYVADGSAYFNRPGPRIVDSLEILAACVHPELFPQHVRAYADAVVRVDEDLCVHAWGTDAPV